MKNYLLASLFLISLSSAARAEDPRASFGGGAAEERAQATYDDIEKTLGVVPQFMKYYPPEAIAGAWSEMKNLQMASDTALSPKDKELIGVGVASQIPCEYCVKFHSRMARVNGANDREVHEAIAAAAFSRHWNTYLNGVVTDEEHFKKDIDKMCSKLRPTGEHEKEKDREEKKPAQSFKTSEEALNDVEETFGFVPSFLRDFPKQGLPGAWEEARQLKLGETTLSYKQKDLIGVAVSAQASCKECVYAETEFAKASGASADEIHEAIALASITRQWSTVLNGTRTPAADFDRELDTIASHVEKKGEGSKAVRAEESELRHSRDEDREDR